MAGEVEAGEVRKPRLISEEPVLVNILRARPKVVSGFPVVDFARDWALGWAEDVGRILRNREFIASNVAYALGMLASQLVRRKLL